VESLNDLRKGAKSDWLGTLIKSVGARIRSSPVEEAVGGALPPGGPLPPATRVVTRSPLMSSPSACARAKLSMCKHDGVTIMASVAFTNLTANVYRRDHISDPDRLRPCIARQVLFISSNPEPDP
jgi:hypothetical protein